MERIVKRKGLPKRKFFSCLYPSETSEKMRVSWQMPSLVLGLVVRAIRTRTNINGNCLRKHNLTWTNCGAGSRRILHEELSEKSITGDGSETRLSQTNKSS